jgi:hypothetical protein
MPLVLAPPADYLPYHLEIDTSPRAPRAGVSTRFLLRVIDPHLNAFIRNFETVHERPLHLFILSQDLAYFAHVHPTLRRDGSFIYTGVLPTPGAYRLIADFLPVAGAPQMLQQTVVTAGYTGSLLPGAQPAEDLADKVVEGVRVHLSLPPPVGGREQLLTFEFFDAVSGAPVTDLEPYLGATGHLLFVSSDLQTVAHSHPVSDMTGAVGPAVVFQALFPRAGRYRLWVQVQRHGRVLVAPFTAIARSRQILER